MLLLVNPERFYIIATRSCDNYRNDVILLHAHWLIINVMEVESNLKSKVLATKKKKKKKTHTNYWLSIPAKKTGLATWIA